MDQTKSSITLVNGDYFDLLNPESYSFDISVIAHALSNICRYTGHSNRFYSVAEHSVLVSRSVPSDLALCGLLHDASEAFVGDVSSPLKRLLPEYQRIEDRIQGCIAKAFGLPYPFPSEVHTADKVVYATERREVAAGTDTLWYTEFKPDPGLTVVGWRPEAAKDLFLERYKEITRVYA